MHSLSADAQAGYRPLPHHPSEYSSSFVRANDWWGHTRTVLATGLCLVILSHGHEAAAQQVVQKEQPEGKQKPSPFKKPQKRSKRIRSNPGAWNPIVDTTDVFTGNRNVDERGRFNLYDGVLGVKIRVEQAQRSEPLLEANPDWEGNSVSPLFIWKTDGLYHMIYESSGGTCTATSVDGLDWERPELGQVEFEGSSKNNMLRNGIRGATGVFYDPHADPQERFKAMGGDMAWYDPETLQRLEGEIAWERWLAFQKEPETYTGPRAEIWGRTLGWISPDGLDWKELEQPLGNRAVNGGISGYYDPIKEEYIAYLQIMGDRSEVFPGIGSGQIEVETQRRTIGFSRTKDFRHWPAPKLILSPDTQDDLDISFYGANYFPYPGRSDLHTMIIPIYHQSTDEIDTQIAFSRDGIFWSRPERRALHTVGPLGSGEEAMAHTWRSGMIVLPDGRWAVPYTGISNPHNITEKYRKDLVPHWRPLQIRYALWEPHRFCGIEAETEGKFTIPTIYRQANEIRMNYRCAAGGWISVELVSRRTAVSPDPDALEGFAFDDCDRLIGDETDKVLTWNGNSDISKIGGTVALRIKMFQAKLFAYKL